MKMSRFRFPGTPGAEISAYFRSRTSLSLSVDSLGPGWRLGVGQGVVEGFAARKAFVDPVVIGDALLPQLPAQVYLLAAAKAGEVDQSYIQVFDHAAGLLDSLDGFLEL